MKYPVGIGDYGNVTEWAVARWRRSILDGLGSVALLSLFFVPVFVASQLPALNDRAGRCGPCRLDELVRPG